MPTSSANARSLRVPAPSRPAPTTNSAVTGRSVARDVLSERMNTWFMARLAESWYVILPVLANIVVFSSSLSNTTTVSYSE